MGRLLVFSDHQGSVTLEYEQARPGYNLPGWVTNYEMQIFHAAVVDRTKVARN